MADPWPADHADCQRSLVAHMAANGTHVTATERRPIVPNCYSTDPYRCPHNATFWLTPAADTI